jgi:predicted metal-dependent phosphoesterase TrpH
MPSYRIELHSHCKGDPVDSYIGHDIFQHIDRAKEIGLDAIAVTWHRKICSVPEAEAYARDRGILLIPGMEAEVDRRHLVVLNLTEGDLPAEPTWNQVRSMRLRKPDVLVLAPHPYYPHPSCLGTTMHDHADCIDAVEWCFIHVNWLPGHVNPNLRAARWAREHGKTVVACSDAHSLATIGRNASFVEADELTPEALFAGIRAGRVSFDRKSLALKSLVYETSKAMSSQPRHIGGWVKCKLTRRRTYPSAGTSSSGLETSR